MDARSLLRRVRVVVFQFISFRSNEVWIGTGARLETPSFVDEMRARDAWDTRNDVCFVFRDGFMRARVVRVTDGSVCFARVRLGLRCARF